MSCFKRAEWRSGLTYRQTCRSCGQEMVYQDNVLDFRPWYPDGFVYCSRCNTPLRHSEMYAIDAPPGPVARGPMDVASMAPNAGVNAFCPQCGVQYQADARFCTNCGHKRM